MTRIVGIDLGTTNSLVAYMQGETPAVIPGEDGSNLVPSVVALDEHNQPIIGNAARRHLIETPERAVYSVFFLTTLAAGILLYALIAGDYRLAYVAQNSNKAMPR